MSPASDSHQCCVVNERGQYYRYNGTWGPYGPLVLLFPNPQAMQAFFVHSKIKPSIRWV